MKKKSFLPIFLVIFVFIISVITPYISHISIAFNGDNYDDDNLNSFLKRNFISEEEVVKIDDKYYSLKNDNRIISLDKMDYVTYNELINDKKGFKDLLFRELRKKYPLFIVESFWDFDYSTFNILSDAIYIAYNIDDGNMYDVTLVCRDYKEYVDFSCIDDIDDDPNIITIDPNKKIVALTFDDGPSVYTDSVIEQLNNFNMKATFFELGSLMEKYPDIVKRVKENGFEIGSHGYSHKSFTKLKVEGTQQEIDKTNEIYRSITGEDIKMVRPPYGSINVSIRDSISTTFVKWSVDSLDWKVKDERYVENIMSTVKDGDIILVHDIQKTTAEHLSSLLTRLYNEGFQVVTVSELAQTKGVSLEVNKVYYYFRDI